MCIFWAESKHEVLKSLALGPYRQDKELEGLPQRTNLGEQGRLVYLSVPKSCKNICSTFGWTRGTQGPCQQWAGGRQWWRVILNSPRVNVSKFCPRSVRPGQRGSG